MWNSVTIVGTCWVAVTGARSARRGSVPSEVAVGSAPLTATLTATGPDSARPGTVCRDSFCSSAYCGNSRQTLWSSLGVKGSQVQILSFRQKLRAASHHEMPP